MHLDGRGVPGSRCAAQAPAGRTGGRARLVQPVTAFGHGVASATVADFRGIFGCWSIGAVCWCELQIVPFVASLVALLVHK